MPLTSFKNQVIPILREVRDIVLPFYGNAGKVNLKEDKSEVTELDVKVEKFLTMRLKEVDSSIEFVGEEAGGNREAKTFWLADPIDGTAHFIRGMPFCTTMLALIQNGEVVFGAIYDFIHDDMYTAEKGKGATLNGAPIHVSERPLQGAYIGWESHLDKKENLETYQALEKRCVSFKSISAGFEHAMVASGKLDGKICFDPYGKDYDFAPGVFLIQEAGGIAANIGKKSYDYRNVSYIAANPKIYKELTEGPDALFKN